MTGGPKYTEFAQQAVSLADLFQSAFAKRVGSTVLYKVALATPDGPSTGGGKQSTQHLTLTPDNGAAKLVIGAADTVKTSAELRSYAFVAAQHAARFQGALYPLEKEIYDDLLKKLVGFFELQQYQVTVSQPTADMEQQALQAGGKKGGLPVAAIVGAAVGLLALGAAAMFLLKK